MYLKTGSLKGGGPAECVREEDAQRTAERRTGEEPAPVAGKPWAKLRGACS
jgi:hypothetical protein